MVQFYPWFKFYFPLCHTTIPQKTKGNKIKTKLKIEPQHSYKAHYYSLDYQERGRESYCSNVNLLDRRFSFCYIGQECLSLRKQSHYCCLFSTDCSDFLKSGYSQSGVYSVNPDGKGSFNVYCDMRTDGGGWAVFQRRQDGSVDFYRGWNDYKSGFGQLTAEFWLGNDKIHRLTAAEPRSLRVEVEDWNGVKAYAKYGKFNIGDEQAKYRLDVGSYSGTAGDSLISGHNNMAFSTKDRDNDRAGNCAVSYTGAWWYKSCHYSNLNGKYLGDKVDSRGVTWYHFSTKYLSLKFSEMKLR